jgi:hypothetical protein
VIVIAERDPFAFHFMAEVFARYLCSVITVEFGDNSVMSSTSPIAFLDLPLDHRVTWVYEPLTGTRSLARTKLVLDEALPTLSLDLTDRGIVNLRNRPPDGAAEVASGIISALRRSNRLTTRSADS